MPSKSTSKTLVSSTVYNSLVADIRREISSSLKIIEHQKIKTYWSVGRLINRFLSSRKNPIGSIGTFYRRLSKDIDINVRTLQHCEQFFRYFPKISPKPGMTWSHYRYLLALPDAKERQRWMRRIESNGLSANDLRFSLIDVTPVDNGVSPAKPTRGILYTYRIVRDDSEGWMVDCGFTNRINAPTSDCKLQNKYIYTSVKVDGTYQLRITKRSTDQLYAFRAKLLKVVDADTLSVRIDQGFGVWTDQRLRLKGIDAPEMSTLAGKKAQHDLAEYLGDDPCLVVQTHKTDKYDRYLADVFVDKSGEDPHKIVAHGTYLNQWLLDSGLVGMYKQ